MKNLRFLILTSILVTAHSYRAHALFLGDKAQEKQYPSTVALMVPDTSEAEEVKLRCTGSRIAENLILTAAHCFYSSNPDARGVHALEDSMKDGKTIVISSGVELWKSATGYQSVRTPIKIKKTSIHPSYNGKYLDESLPGPFAFTDLAVIEVDPATPLPKSIVIGRLDFAPVKVGDALSIGGYGPEWERGFPQYLKMSSITFQKLEDGMMILDAGVVMAGMPPACIMPGDSGGPVYRVTNKMLSIVGVNSRVGFKTQYMTRFDNKAPNQAATWLKGLLKQKK